jgi:hypothetical protein
VAWGPLVLEDRQTLRARITLRTGGARITLRSLRTGGARCTSIAFQSLRASGARGTGGARIALVGPCAPVRARISP